MSEALSKCLQRREEGHTIPSTSSVWVIIRRLFLLTIHAKFLSHLGKKEHPRNSDFEEAGSCCFHTHKNLGLQHCSDRLNILVQYCFTVHVNFTLLLPPALFLTHCLVPVPSYWRSKGSYGLILDSQGSEVSTSPTPRPEQTLTVAS